MKTQDDEVTSKQKILKAAAEIFADRGYDGARVDEIAKRAGVNKALIYYYFKGKSELLAILFRETMEATIHVIPQNEEGQFDLHDKESMSALLNPFLDVLEERQNIVRVMLMESLKRSPVNDLIFSMIREIITRLMERSSILLEASSRTNESVMVIEFFTGIMPILNYVVYHESWMDRFNMDEGTLRGQFIEAFIGTHIAYSALVYGASIPVRSILDAVKETELENTTKE